MAMTNAEHKKKYYSKFHRQEILIKPEVYAQIKATCERLEMSIPKFMIAATIEKMESDSGNPMQ